MVYVVKATSELPLPSLLPARPTLIPVKSVYEEVLQVPLVNKPLEDALAVWAQHCFSAKERGRRILTYSMHSSTVRASTASQKLLKCSLIESIFYNEALQYKVEVSLPHCFDLPETVTIPVKEGINVPRDALTECGCVDVPLRFQAHAVGEFTCNVVLTSCFDTRVYQLKASVTQRLNETLQNWSVQAEVCGEGFLGPEVIDVPAGTKQTYPLTVLPTSQCIATGRLCLHNDFDGTEHVFTLRRVGEPPLPLDHIVLSCPVGKTTYAKLDIPNYTQKTLTLRAVTDLEILSGSPSLEISPGQRSPYTLAVFPWKRGEYTGSVSFIEHGDMDERENNKGNSIGNYIVIFSLVVNCNPEAPIKVIDVQCVAKSSVAIEIPVSNPGEELLTLDVCLEGGDLTGDNQISLPPRGTLSYRVTYSPVSVGKDTGSVVFQSELIGEFWYQLELYALPPSVVTLPQAHCHLGKWVRINIPLVNPTAETLKLIVANSNPRHYSLEMDSAETIMLAPKSCTHVGVRFSPSSIGEENHHGKISFTCSQLQDCCVLLSGCGLRPEVEEPLCMSCLIGSSTSISVPILNPTDHQATLNITITAEDPNHASNCEPINDEKAFSCSLDHAEGTSNKLFSTLKTKDRFVPNPTAVALIIFVLVVVLQISERATVGVPVVFTPKTMELQKAWLCITMKPISGQDSTGSRGELLDISWIYPLRGISVGAPFESSPHAVLQCEVGGQLESTVDVQLTGYVPGNQELRGQQGLMEDFLCTVGSDSETARSTLGNCLSISIKAARRDPESGVIMLTLCLIYTPRRRCRFSSVLAVQSSTGKVWEFPFILIATKPQVDDVIRVETTEIGRTSAVGFRLTSTTRRSTAFKATFLPGSSTEFTVAPASGMLPPAGTAGALISVFFTPTESCKSHRARLAVQAADMQWIYDVRGKTSHDPQLLRTSSTKDSLLAPHPPKGRQRNFVVQNLRIPFLANSSLACTPFVWPAESLENVAPAGIASQSSTAHPGVASRAVDGNRDPEYSHESCTQTLGEPNPWWSLLLPVVYRVTTVSITNRNVQSERINNAEILVGNSLENNGKNNPRCAVISSIPHGGTKTFNCTGMTGRMLTVKISTSYGILTMCELEIYGEPAAPSPSFSAVVMGRRGADVQKKLCWSEALLYCREHYWDLLSVRSEQEQRGLEAVLKTQPSWQTTPPLLPDMCGWDCAGILQTARPVQGFKNCKSDIFSVWIVFAAATFTGKNNTSGRSQVPAVAWTLTTRSIGGNFPCGEHLYFVCLKGKPTKSPYIERRFFCFCFKSFRGGKCGKCKLPFFPPIDPSVSTEFEENGKRVEFYSFTRHRDPNLNNLYLCANAHRICRKVWCGGPVLEGFSHYAAASHVSQTATQDIPEILASLCKETSSAVALHL
ncbi:hypothetical protein CCH79_00013415 [Gambusia affinis]|uniref:Fucolectin tachylectin-4 pentraxin-1 domain-containing protein n=1 Tax=Gambusia affinis TaxID=33528 RepID=A0A315W8Y4_GAMAF|nr:hypothetical protein CCH79_00013415 [Gambusia affinis]